MQAGGPRDRLLAEEFSMKWFLASLATVAVLLSGVERSGAFHPAEPQAPRVVVPSAPPPMPSGHVPAPPGTMPGRPGVMPAPPATLPVPAHGHFHLKYRCPPGANRCFQNQLQARQFETRLKELG